MGLPAAQAFDVLISSKSLTDIPQQLEMECEKLFQRLLEARLQPMPGMIKLLDVLDELGLPRCIATSSRTSFAQRALRIVELLERFAFVITANDVAAGKPAPQDDDRRHPEVRQDGLGA